MRRGGDDIADWHRMDSEGCDHSHQTPPQNIAQVEGKILCSIWPGCFTSKPLFNCTERGIDLNNNDITKGTNKPRKNDISNTDNTCNDNMNNSKTIVLIIMTATMIISNSSSHSHNNESNKNNSTACWALEVLSPCFTYCWRPSSPHDTSRNAPAPQRCHREPYFFPGSK